MELIYRGTMLVAIIDAEIHVRARIGLPACPRTAQGDRHDAFDLPEPCGHPLG
jgi:hypothetical protein